MWKKIEVLTFIFQLTFGISVKGSIFLSYHMAAENLERHQVKHSIQCIFWEPHTLKIQLHTCKLLETAEV